MDTPIEQIEYQGVEAYVVIYWKSWFAVTETLATLTGGPCLRAPGVFHVVDVINNHFFGNQIK